jgi:hypothetical protein
MSLKRTNKNNSKNPKGTCIFNKLEDTETTKRTQRGFQQTPKENLVK